MAYELTCRQCGRTLTVGPGAPAKVWCPHCRAEVDNPHAGRERRVIPLESQADNDLRTTTAGLAAMALIVALIGGGAVLSAARVSAGVMALWGVLVLVLGVPLLLVAREGKHRRGAVPARGVAEAERVAPPAAAPPPLPPMTERGNVIEYRRPMAVHTEPEFGIGPFILGFFAALGVSAGAFFAMATTADVRKTANWAVAVGVLAAYAGLIAGSRALGKRPAWGGVGRGVAVGLGLGLIAVGPCAGCYFISLMGGFN